MVRRILLPAALIAVIATTMAEAAQQQPGQDPAPAYADPVVLKRVRESLAAPAPGLVIPPLPPEPTFRVEVVGRRPFVQSFNEVLVAELTPRFEQPRGGVDVLPFLVSAVKKYKTARARKQVADELAEFLRTHPQDP